MMSVINEDKVVEHFFDDENAIKLLNDLWVVMQAWDDAEDGDEADHSYAYKKAMIDLPRNPLYIQCSVPFLVEQAYIKWCAANVFESNNVELHKAYMLRADYFSIIVAIYSFINGVDKAAEKAHEIYTCYSEKFDDYAEEFKSA